MPVARPAVSHAASFCDDSDYIYRSVHTVDDARLFNRASMGFIQNLLRKLERCFFYDPVSSDPAARGDNLVLVF